MRSEIIDYADHAAGVLATSGGQLNPYKLGVELYRNIEERWDRGQFGKEWEECDDLDAKKNWNLRLGLGKKKIFEVRALYNDVTFIDEFLTPDFCRDHKLFSFSLVEPQRALRDRDARVQGGEGEAPLPADERRQPVHLRRGRELREPRRAPPPPRSPGARPAAGLREGGACGASSACGSGP